ncbi:MAG: PT domain-containing protein [Eubacterium sp.]|nr:PT domain-containing protein [Eubacterium sp.]
MRKSFKKAVAVVSAIAMVVAGISYKPATASAEALGKWSNIYTMNECTVADTSTDDTYGVSFEGYSTDTTWGGDSKWQGQAQIAGYPVTNGGNYKISFDVTASAEKQFIVQTLTGGVYTENTYSSADGHVDMLFTAKGADVQVTVAFGALSATDAGTFDIAFSNLTITETQEEITTEEVTTATADDDGFTSVTAEQKINDWTLFAGANVNWGGGKISEKGTRVGMDLAVRVDNATTEWWGIQAKYHGLEGSLDASKTYDVTLKFDASKAGKLAVKLDGYDNNDGTQYDIVSGTNTITRNDITGVTTITPVFALIGTEAGTIIDFTEISIAEKSEETTVEETTVEETTVEETTVEETTVEETTEAPTEVAGYDWVKLGNGSGEAAGDAVYYDDNSDVNVSFVNIQKSFGTEAGIYTTYAAGISSVVVNGVQQPSSCIQGAGALIYLSSLTQEINEVTVDYAGETASFLIKTENPATPSDETTEAPTEEPTEASTEAPTEEPTEKQPGEFVVIQDDGGQDTEYSYDNSTGATIVNIQSPGFTTERGIYTNVPSGISSVTVNGTAVDAQNIQGAGAIIPLASLVEGENTVVIVHALGTETVIVKYEPAATTTYAVSVDGTKVADVEAGDTYTLPTTAQYGYFAGDDLYKAGAQVVVNGDIDFTSLNSVAVEMANGAVVKNAAPTGIAFQATVTVNENEEAVDAAFLSTGMLITANDLFVEKGGSELTLDSDYTFKDVANTGWFAGNTGTYRAGITGVTSENYIRKFIARGYAKLTYTDGTDTVVYSGMSPVRSIQQVAQAAINAGYGNDFLAECAAAK